MFEEKTHPIRLIGPCPKVEQIIRAASGELTQAEMTRVGEHVAACTNCAETFRIAGGNVDAWRQFAAQTKTPVAAATPQQTVPAAPAPPASLPPGPAAAAAPRRRSRAWRYAPIGIAVAAIALFVALLVPVVRSVKTTYTKTAKRLEATRASLKAVAGGQNGSLLTPSGIQSQLANVSQSLSQMREANAKFRDEVNRPDVLTRTRNTVIALDPPTQGNIAPNKVLKRVQHTGFTLRVTVKETDKALEIVNSTGARLWRGAVNPGSAMASIKFGGGDLQPGIYQLRTLSGDGQSASAVYPFQVLN